MKTIINGQTKWQNLQTSLEECLKLTEDEKERLKNSDVAQLITDIVYTSGCENPERVVMSQLSLYILATRTEIFQHQKGETIEQRISLLCHFPGGNEEVKKAGKILLSLVSVYDHMKDREQDRTNKKYNPVTEMDINFREYVTAKLEEFETLDEKIQQAFEKYTNGLAFFYWW